MTCCPKDRGLLLFCSSLESNFEIPRISKQKRTSKKKKTKLKCYPGSGPQYPIFCSLFQTDVELQLCTPVCYILDSDTHDGKSFIQHHI